MNRNGRTPDREGEARGGPSPPRPGLALAAAASAVVITDPNLPDNPIVYANPAFERTTGYPAGEAIGRNCRFLQNGDGGQPALEGMRTALKEGRGWAGVLRNYKKDGAAFWNELQVAPVRDEGGRLVNFVGVQTDVTGRKEAEEALKGSEAKYRTLVERVPAVIYTQEVEHGYALSYVGPQIEAMLGYPAGEYASDPRLWIERVHPDDRERVLAEDRRTDETGEPFRMEYRKVARDGSVVWVRDETVLVEDPAGGEPYWHGVMTDVTERRRAEEALRESEERFRYMVQNSSDLITLVGADGTVRYSSPALERILGYAPEERAGKSVFGLVHPDDAGRARRLFAEGLRSPGVPLKLEVRQRRKDGSWRDVEVTGTNLLSEPSAGAVVLNSRDVTERKAYEEALEESEERYRAVVEQTAEGIYLLDVGTRRVLEANAAFGELLGYPPEELPGMAAADFVTQDREELEGNIRRTLEEGRRFVGERRYRRKDGSLADVEVNVSVISYGGRRVICAAVRDVTERKRAEEALRESEERHRAVVEQAGEGIFLFDPRTKRILEANPAFQKMFGYAPEELAQKTLHDLVPHDRGGVDRNAERTLERGHVLIGERQYRHKDGSAVDVEVSGSVISYGGGEAICSVVRDVTERKRAEEALRGSEERFRSLVQNSSDVVGVVDAEGTVRYLSPSVERVLGYEPEDLVGKDAFDRVYPDDLERVRHALAESLGVDGAFGGELRARFRHADGSWRHMEALLTNLLSDPAVGGVVVNSRDVTEREALEEQLRHRALYDPLTGLPNRALFLDRLGHALAHPGRLGRSVAVLFMDLDNFKVVNDSLGHEAGDELLVSAAERLGARLRAGETLARFGGDEFTVLLEGAASAGDAERAAERVAGRIGEVLREPFALRGREMFVTASIGIAPGTAGRDRPEELLRRADAAMYRAKAAGKARYGVYDPAMRAQTLKRLELENDLRRAVERGEFAVRYQPKVSLGTGGVVGFEALVRWEHPEKGLLPPSEFVPLAEETGLIVPIGEWVLEEACRRAKGWQELCPSDPPVAVCVNLSSVQFREPGLTRTVARVLRETGLDPRGLVLEVTEGAAMGDAPATVAAFRGLKALGVRLALDDFGTGYSSLSYLSRFPVDHVKIDRSFVGKLGEESGAAVLVRGVIELAHALGLGVIAEGVETEGQLERLREMGCDMAQGFYLSEPVAAEGVPELLARDRRR